MTLSSVTVLVPAYNEEATVAEVIRRVRARAAADLELIVIDDGSTDGTARAVASVIDLVDVFVRLPVNRGRACAIREGLARATGDVIVFQDADLELDPAIIPDLAQPILEGRADFVAGYRLHAGNRPHMSAQQWWVNRALTKLTCLVLGIRMTDAETCAKAFPRRLLAALDIESTGFELEPEILAKLARLGVRIEEFPISFRPRTRAEGKKIRASDALWAVTTLFRHRSWQPTPAALLRALPASSDPQVRPTLALPVAS